MVILSRGVLFTEVNVILPASFLNCSSSQLYRGAARFWGLACLGNILGAFAIGNIIAFAQYYPQDVHALLSALVAKKPSYSEIGGVGAWLQVVVSGMLGNWLVGMAAFFAVMANTIVGKFVPVFLAVTLFVATNLQHSPANMGYFSLVMAHGTDPGWSTALFWNIISAALGNILGGTLLVALPFWYALRPDPRRDVTENPG